MGLRVGGRVGAGPGAEVGIRRAMGGGKLPLMRKFVAVRLRVENTPCDRGEGQASRSLFYSSGGRLTPRGIPGETGTGEGGERCSVVGRRYSPNTPTFFAYSVWHVR